MQRCPACNARLNGATHCPRCATDLSSIVRCERLAEQWLSVSLQSLRAGLPDVALPAVLRSLSFKQRPAARLVKDFLVRYQYRALYESLGRKHWAEAANILSGLRRLQEENEALYRFDEMIGYLSVLSDSERS